MDLNRAKFVIAAHKPSQWLSDGGREVAFAGRSNSGKSSALNAITGHRSLAITSKKPGRTQQIIFFEINDTTRLVDLPGYGYSKVPQKMRMHWAKVIGLYFKSRQSLSSVILTMDIRHPMKALDIQLLDLCAQSELKTHILLTKADKLSKSKIASALKSVRFRFQDNDAVTVQAFSSRTKIGVDQARSYISGVLEIKV